MKRIYRRTAFLLSLAAFLTLSPLLALYAVGYRYVGQSGSTQAVGVVLVETTPRRADLAINGEPRGTTPRAIANLPPGKVEVAVTADGYQPYRKQLVIEPGQITEARAIRLIPAALQPELLLAGVDQFSLSPSRRVLAVRQEGRLSILDTDGASILPARATPAVSALLWSPDSTRLLLQHPNGTVSMVSLADATVQPLPALSRASHIVWDPRVPGRLLALLPDATLIAHHVVGGRSEVLAENITAFDVSARSIYAVDTALQLRHLTLQAEVLATRALPPASLVSRLLITPAGRVALHFADGSLALLTDEHELQPVAASVIRAGWSPDGQLLYLQTDPSSVHIYNAADERHASIAIGQQQLVLRLSRPVRDVQWFAGGGHLVFQVDDEIRLAEVDTRDHVHTYTIDSTNLGQSQTEVGEEGRQLFYLKQHDGVTSLFSTSLLTESVGRLLGKNILR